MPLAFAIAGTRSPKGIVSIFAVKDVCSRQIVNWATPDQMTSRLAQAVLLTAIARIRPMGTAIGHSDCGVQERFRQ